MMSLLPNVDLVVTSPPYNLGNNHHTGNNRFNPYDDDLPENEYQEWQIKLLKSIPISDNGSIFYNHKTRIKDGKLIHPIEWLLKTNLVLKQELVWLQRSQNFDPCRFFPMTERIYWLSKSAETKIKNNRFKDYFNWNPVGINDRHGREFPIDYPKTIMTVAKGIVLDPFLGSGTTLVACKELKRNGIGIEISPKYCETAKKRLQNTQVPML